MPLNLDAAAQISRAVAREHDPVLHAAGVTSTEGGSDRIELLITIEGCHQEQRAPGAAFDSHG
jgi:hypothetical protein